MSVRICLPHCRQQRGGSRRQRLAHSYWRRARLNLMLPRAISVECAHRYRSWTLTAIICGIAILPNIFESERCRWRRCLRKAFSRLLVVSRRQLIALLISYSQDIVIDAWLKLEVCAYQQIGVGLLPQETA